MRHLRWRGNPSGLSRSTAIAASTGRHHPVFTRTPTSRNCGKLFRQSWDDRSSSARRPMRRNTSPRMISASASCVAFHRSFGSTCRSVVFCDIAILYRPHLVLPVGLPHSVTISTLFRRRQVNHRAVPIHVSPMGSIGWQVQAVARPQHQLLARFR